MNKIFIQSSLLGCFDVSTIQNIPKVETFSTITVRTLNFE